MRPDPPETAMPGCLSPPRAAASVRVVAPAELDPGVIAAWRELSTHALEPNAYLTPMFVLPALAHLGSALPVRIFLIESECNELIGVGVFNIKRLLPLFGGQFLVGYRSRHSFLSGLLVDLEQAELAVDAFFAFVSRPATCWHGVRFDWLNTDNRLGHLLLESARRHNIWWSESERMRRAVLLPKGEDARALINRIPGYRLKELRRCLRRLGEKGKLDWHIHSGAALTEAVVERFLALEHMGWKGEAGTSVRANPAHEQFFTAMIAGFRETGGVFFTELLHDGRVIASTCNLLSGNSAFAFKIGWDPAYARFSPGMLNELYLLERANEIFGHLDLIDSGSVEGSFIDKLWFDKRELLSGVFATTRTGKLCFALAAARRRLRHGLAGLKTRGAEAWRRSWLGRAIGWLAPARRTLAAGQRQALPRCSQVGPV